MHKWLKVIVLVLLVLIAAMAMRNTTLAASRVVSQNGVPALLHLTSGPVPPTPWQLTSGPVPPTPWQNKAAAPAHR